jgi:hypothetical protein
MLVARLPGRHAAILGRPAYRAITPGRARRRGAGEAPPRGRRRGRRGPARGRRGAGEGPPRGQAPRPPRWQARGRRGGGAEAAARAGRVPRVHRAAHSSAVTGPAASWRRPFVHLALHQPSYGPPVRRPLSIAMHTAGGMGRDCAAGCTPRATMCVRLHRRAEPRRGGSARALVGRGSARRLGAEARRGGSAWMLVGRQLRRVPARSSGRVRRPPGRTPYSR